jgi:Phosphoesterase family
MRLTRIAIGAAAAAAVAWMVTPAMSSANTANSAIPHYQHIVEIMMENTSYGTIIGNPNAPQLNALADHYGLATNYFGVTSEQWRQGRNAIVVTWDEDDFSDEGQPGTGCCGADPGGGHVATIVITNMGKHPVKDNTAYNHYSLLLSLEDAFGLPCLANACDAADGVKPMTPLFHP